MRRSLFSPSGISGWPFAGKWKNCRRLRRCCPGSRPRRTNGRSAERGLKPIQAQSRLSLHSRCGEVINVTDRLFQAGKQKGRSMQVFTIDKNNNITVFGALKDVANEGG